MALTHVTAVRNSIADLVVGAIDAHATLAGYVEIDDNADFATPLVTITLNDPSFAAAAAGVAAGDVTPPPEGTVGVAGTASVFRILDGGDTEVFRGTVTVTGGGGDMEMSSVVLAVSDVVRINSMSYTAPA